MVNPWSFSAWANWSQKTLSSTIAHLSSSCLVFFKNDHPFLPPANEVWGKVIFLHLSVILSTGGRGSTWAGTPHWHVHPLGRYTPWAGIPPAGTPPGRYTPWQVHPHPMVHAWAVCILLECILLVIDIVFITNFCGYLPLRH